MVSRNEKLTTSMRSDAKTLPEWLRGTRNALERQMEEQQTR